MSRNNISKSKSSESSSSADSHINNEESASDEDEKGRSQTSLSDNIIGHGLDEAIQKKPPIAPTPDENKLQFAYSIWYSHKAARRQYDKNSAHSYEQSIKLLGSFCTVEQFWSYYCHMTRPSELTGPWDFHVFKYNVKPLWEDEANKNGGKWIVRVAKGKSSRPWESVLLAMLGEQFMVGGEICGVVLSLRYQDDIISVWNRTSNDAGVTSRIRDTLRRVLNLPQSAAIEYRKHTDSLKQVHSYSHGQSTE